jgi:hypothetical protein
MQISPTSSPSSTRSCSEGLTRAPAPASATNGVRSGSHPRLAPAAAAPVPTQSAPTGEATGSSSLPRLVFVAALFSVLTLLALPGDAMANGRFPSALFMTFGPGDSSPTMGLQTTFGYVFSRDRGQTWQLRCEEAIGFDSIDTWDPALVLTDTRAIAGLPQGLSVAATDYCAFNPATTVPDEPVVDLASDPSGQKVVAALGPIADPNGVALSDDGGVTWRRGATIQNFLILTVDVAPSRPQRVYASGLINGNTGGLFRSDDGGATFTEATRAFGTSAYVYISAVDPQNPDRVYVRVDLNTAGTPGGTILSVSSDGGTTFGELKRSHNRMTGFAISPDGKTLWSASPGDLPDDGVYRSTDSGQTWQPMSGGHTTLCLRHHDGILYMCTPPEMNNGIALTCSSNGGETFNPVLTWAELAGPESCPASTPGRDLCNPNWDALRARLVTDGGMPPPGPRGCPRAPTGDGGPPDAPVDAPVDAGQPDAPADTARADAGPDAPRTPAPADDGCGCRLGRNGGGAGSLPLLLLAALALLRARRR